MKEGYHKKSKSSRSRYKNSTRNLEIETQGSQAELSKVPFHAVIQESLMLSDNEVMVSFMKFMIGVAILNFPAQSQHLGVVNGFVSTAVICFFIIKTNEHLVKAIPLELMNQNLTLG